MSWTQWPPPTGMAPPNMPGMPGMPGMTGMPGMSGMPGMTGMPGMPGMPMASAPVSTMPSMTAAPVATTAPMAPGPYPAAATAPGPYPTPAAAPGPYPTVAAAPGPYPAAAASLDQWTQMQQQNWQQWAQWQQQYQQWHQQYGEEYQKIAALQQHQQQPTQPPLPVHAAAAAQPPPPRAELKPPLPPDDPPPPTASNPAKGYNTYSAAPPPVPTPGQQAGYSTQPAYGALAPPLPPPPEEAKQPAVGPGYGYGYGGSVGMQHQTGGYNTSAPPPTHQQPSWNPQQHQNKPPNIQQPQQPQQQNNPPNQQQQQWGKTNDMTQGNNTQGTQQGTNQNQRSNWENQQGGGNQGRNSWGGNQNSGGTQGAQTGRYSSGAENSSSGDRDGAFGANQRGQQQGGYNGGGNNQAPPSLLSLNIQKPFDSKQSNFGPNNAQDFNQGGNTNQEFGGNRLSNDFGSGNNNNKRPYEQNQNSNQPLNFDAKRNKMDNQQQQSQQSWQSGDDNATKPIAAQSVADDNKDAIEAARIDAGKQQEIIDDMTEAERKFMKQFAEWEAQFNKWKEQNQDHPDKDQYKQYEKKWETWRNQLLDRREQMRKKRLAAQMKIQVHHIQAATAAAAQPTPTPVTPTKPSLTPQPLIASPPKPQPVVSQPQKALPQPHPQQTLSHPQQTLSHPQQTLPHPQQVPPLHHQQVPPQPQHQQHQQQQQPTMNVPPMSTPDFNRPPPFLNNEPLQFKGKPQPPQAIPGQTVPVGQSSQDSNSGLGAENAAAEPENEFLKTSTTSSTVGGIPGLDFSEDSHKHSHTDVSKSAKPGPDLEALSMNINNILGDAKLLSMLSMVSQNKNVPSPEPEPVVAQPAVHLQYEYNQQVLQQQMQWQPASYEEEQAKLMSQQGQTNRQDFSGPPPNFNQAAPGFNKMVEAPAFAASFNDNKGFNENRSSFDDNRSNFNQNRSNFNLSDAPNFDFNNRPPNFNDRPPNFNDRPPNFNDGNNRGNFNLNNRGGFNDNRGNFNDNDNFNDRPKFNDNFRGGNFNNNWNNQQQQRDKFDNRNDNFNRDDDVDNYNEDSLDDNNANYGDNNQDMEDFDQDNYDSFNKQLDVPKNVFPDQEPEPEPQPEPELWSGKLYDYDHKPLKEPEPDVMIEPLQSFDYRHRGVNRIPYPERPKWLADILKNFREFDLTMNRPPTFPVTDRGPNVLGNNRPQFNDSFDKNREPPNFENRGFPSFREDRGPNFDQRGPNSDRSLNFDNRGPNFDKRGPSFDNRGPSNDRGLNFDNRGPNNDRNASLDNRGPNFDKRGPNRERSPNLDNRGPNFDKRGPNFDNRGVNFDKRGSNRERSPNFDKRGPNRERSPNFNNRGFNFDKRGTNDDRGNNRGSNFDNRNRGGPNRNDDRSMSLTDLEDSFHPINSPDSFDNEQDIEDDSFQSPGKFNTSLESPANKRLEFNNARGSGSTANQTKPELEKDAPIFDIANPPPPKKESNVTMIKELLDVPGRFHRPPRIVIILRGPPGSGKTYLAKLIKDTEVEHGGSAPRILSLDDYFIVEQEKEVQEEGKTVKRKEMVYEYEEGMEETYRQSLLKAFKKTITDGYFPFIIVDNVNEKVKYFGEMWSFAKQNGFQVYVCTLDLDAVQCTRRNIHNRTAAQIERIVFGWETTPAHHPVLDATEYTKRDEGIADVEMEDVADSDKDDDKSGGGELLDDMDDACRSKWDTFDCSLNNLAKLDGTSKPLRASTFESYLQMDSASTREDDDFVQPEYVPGGKKRVRWADVEERRKQAKMRQVGFVVGQTDWGRMMDPSQGARALTHTKYIERTARYKLPHK